MGDQNDKPIEDLREVAARLRAGELGDLGLRLARGLDAYFEHAQRRDDARPALGVKAAAGESPWWVDDGLARRDAFVGEYAMRFCGGVVATVERDIGIYAGAWRRDKHRSEMPTGYSGTPRELLYRAFRENESLGRGALPRSHRYIRRVIASYCAESGKARQILPSFSAAECAPSISKQRGDHVGQEDSTPVERRRRRGRG